MRALLLLLVASCVDQQSPLPGKKIDQSAIEPHLLRAAPAGLEHFDVALGGGKVTYLGATFDQKILPPGGVVHARFYWRVDGAIDGNWHVFEMMRGQPNTADFMNLSASDMQLGHPVSSWRTGEIIEDTQDITLRPDWKSGTATLQIGLIEAGGHTAGERMAAAGPHVQDRAIIAHTFDVDLSKAPPPPDTIYVKHAAGPIAIDGAATEAGWANAVASPEFQQGEGCPESLGKATAKMVWDDTNLYVAVSITDPDIVAEMTKHDDHLWDADDIEIFIDADANRHGYVELQVNPNNATFDTWYAGTRGGPPRDDTYESNMVTAVQKKVSHQPQGDVVQGWDVEIAIPWAAVKGKDDAMKVDLPPVVGQRWRLNVVRVDKKTGDKGPAQAASSWNRITCSDWHALDRMLTAVFADAAGNIVPVALPPAPPPIAPVMVPGSAAGSSSAIVPASGSATAVRPTTGKIDDIRAQRLGAEIKEVLQNSPPPGPNRLESAHSPTTTVPPPHAPAVGSGSAAKP